MLDNMVDNNDTQEQKLIQAVELSDAEMEKVSGGSRELDSETWERERSKSYERTKDDITEEWEQEYSESYSRTYS